MNPQPPHSRALLWCVIAAVAAWGAMLALGSYLGLDPQTPDRDIRRMLFIGGSTGLFLAGWLGAPWLRRRPGCGGKGFLPS